MDITTGSCVRAFWAVALATLLVGVARGSVGLVVFTGVLAFGVGAFDGAPSAPHEQETTFVHLDLGSQVAGEGTDRQDHEEAAAADDTPEQQPTTPLRKRKSNKKAPPPPTHTQLIARIVGQDRLMADAINARARSNVAAPPIESREAHVCMLRDTTPPPSRDPYCVLREE